MFFSLYIKSGSEHNHALYIDYAERMSWLFTQTRYNHSHIFRHYHTSRSAVVKKISSIGCADTQTNSMTASVIFLLYNSSTIKLKLINLKFRHNIASYLDCFSSTEEKSAAARLKHNSCGVLFLNESMLLNESTE